VGLLIDSTVFVTAERRRETARDVVGRILQEYGDLELALSVMSAGELVHGCWRADSAPRRARREEFVESILAAIPVVPLTLAIARLYGELDARFTARGRRLPTSDLLIASTALYRGDELLTGNARHFSRIPELTVRRYA
jgi:predicted nucleic acid-binding protein